MALISNFPQNLLQEHAQWHMDHMDETAPGEGVAFLEFHRQFLAKFHVWYASQPSAKPAAIAPWRRLPNKIKSTLNASVVRKLGRIAANPGTYRTEDALGIAIHPLHDQIHVAAAIAYHEAGLGNPNRAPQYTEFWKLHGLIDSWLTRWHAAHP